MLRIKQVIIVSFIKKNKNIPFARYARIPKLYKKKGKKRRMQNDANWFNVIHLKNHSPAAVSNFQPPLLFLS